MYFVITGLLLFPSISYTISLWPSFVYLGESTVWKCEVISLDCVESFKTLPDGFTRVLSNFCKTGPHNNFNFKIWDKINLFAYNWLLL